MGRHGVLKRPCLRACGFESRPGHLRTREEQQQVQRLLATGASDYAIARRTGVPRSTIQRWRVAPPRLAEVFDPAALPSREYAYLLGLYLGDGHLARHRRGVYSLSVYLDQRYPGILDESESAMLAVASGKRVCRVQRLGCVEVKAYWKLWPQVFPQHGPGPKHLRPIVLEPWQKRIVEAETQPFVRGLIHSDGSRFTNTVRHGDKTYAYPRYNFTSASQDIRGLFTAACDRLGIAWRQMNARNISVARREAVERLDAFVGPKR